MDKKTDTIIGQQNHCPVRPADYAKSRLHDTSGFPKDFDY